MVRPAFLVVALLAVTGAASADPPVLGLKDVIAQAVKKNPTLLEAGADVGIADGNLLSAEGIDDFQLDVTGSYKRDVTPIVPGLNSQIPLELTGQLDLTKPLPWGGSLGLRFITDHTRLTAAGAGASAQTESEIRTSSPALDLVWTQPFLRGLGYSAARGALRRARAARDEAALNRTATATTVIRDLAIAYIELAYANEELAVRRDLAQAARDQLARVDANIKAGKMPPSARAEVEFTAGSRDDDAFIVEKVVLDQSLLVRQASGLPMGPGQTYIVAGDPLDERVEVPSLEQALERAHSLSPQLLAAQAHGRTSKVDVEVADNGILPQLDLNVIAGPVGLSTDTSEAFRQMVHFDGYTVQASLAYHDTLGRRGVRGAALTARETFRKAQLTEADIRAQIDFAVVQLQTFALQAQRRLDVLTPTSKAAALDLDAERARFEVGRSTNFDVLRRQSDVAEARLRHSRALADLLRARAELEAATGEILARYGVVIK